MFIDNDSDIGIDEDTDDNDLVADQDILQVVEKTEDRFVRVATTNTSLDFPWTSNRQTFTGHRETFTRSSGPTFPVTDDMTPLNIFFKMFDEEFLNILVTETNRYADQTLTKLRQDPRTKKHNRCLTWSPTDRSDMLTFLAVVILQGLYPKVNEESYFTWDGYGTTPYFFSYNNLQ